MRGSLYENVGPLPVVVVSSNPRNQTYPEVLVCSILPSDTAMPPQDTVVQLGNAEPIQGYITADFIFPLRKAILDQGNNPGTISRQATAQLDRALAVALGLI